MATSGEPARPDVLAARGHHLRQRYELNPYGKADPQDWCSPCKALWPCLGMQVIEWALSQERRADRAERYIAEQADLQHRSLGPHMADTPDWRDCDFICCQDARRALGLRKCRAALGGGA